MNIKEFINSSPNYSRILDYRPNVRFTFKEVQILYDFLSKMINSSGPDFTVFHHVLFLDNYKIVHKAMIEIDTTIKKYFNDDDIKKSTEYNEKCAQLVEKYADRDEQGNVVKTESGQVSITENLVEYQKSITSLYNEYKRYIDAANNKSIEYENFLNNNSIDFEKFLLFNEFERYNGVFTPLVFGIYLSKYK